jgi:hypothetical protein
VQRCLAAEGYEFKIEKVANVPPGGNLLVNWTKTAGDAANVKIFTTIYNQTWFDTAGRAHADAPGLLLLDSDVLDASSNQAIFRFDRYEHEQSGLAHGCVLVYLLIFIRPTQPCRWYQVWMTAVQAHTWWAISDWFYFGAEEGSTIPR